MARARTYGHGRLAEVVADLHWYALLVPPQKEFVAQEILKRQGIVTFCPYDGVWRLPHRYTKEKRLVRYPMMPRYVFAGFVPNIPLWFDIFNLQIVKGVVGRNGEPARIANMAEFFAKFRNGLIRPDHERYMRTHMEFKAGDMVIVKGSPFDGWAITVDEIRDGQGFFQVEMMGKDFTLCLPLDQFEKAA